MNKVLTTMPHEQMKYWPPKYNNKNYHTYSIYMILDLNTTIKKF